MLCWSTKRVYQATSFAYFERQLLLKVAFQLKILMTSYSDYYMLAQQMHSKCFPYRLILPRHGFIVPSLPKQFRAPVSFGTKPFSFVWTVFCLSWRRKFTLRMTVLIETIPFGTPISNLQHPIWNQKLIFLQQYWVCLLRLKLSPSSSRLFEQAW